MNPARDLRLSSPAAKVGRFVWGEGGRCEDNVPAPNEIQNLFRLFHVPLPIGVWIFTVLLPGETFSYLCFIYSVLDVIPERS